MRTMFAAFMFAGAASAAFAQTLTPDETARVDSIVQAEIARVGAPSASVSVLRGGVLAYSRAFGFADLDSKKPASPTMRYPIGSVSKQFTAAAILLLAEEGRLRLDDPVARYLPDVPQAGRVTIRQLLSHTSGYRDYYPQDFTPLEMTRQTTPREITTRWGMLDFEPGTRWQYSNTGYVIAGRIVEKLTGRPPSEFVGKRIFAPLGMTSAISTETSEPLPGGPVGYERRALGPWRRAHGEQKGWMFAAGEYAMTAADLAKWNEARAERRILSVASWEAMERVVLLKDGRSSGYGLGVFPITMVDHRGLEHGGEVSGFLTENIAFPDDRAGVSVLVNAESGDAGPAIASKIAREILFPASQTGAARAEAVYRGLMLGRIDPAQFTENGRAFFDRDTIADYRASLAAKGAPSKVTARTYALRGGFTAERYDVTTPHGALTITVRAVPGGGPIEQFTIDPGA